MEHKPDPTGAGPDAISESTAMLNVPALTEMLTVSGVALLIAAVAVIALGALTASVARRSQTTTAGLLLPSLPRAGPSSGP